MKSYKIHGMVMLSFTTPQDQYDALYGPGFNTVLECDGETIWLCNGETRVETITSANAIDAWVNEGCIEEIKEVVMASTNNNPYVKFTYFKDTESPRTVTAARMLDGDKMYIDWCVNHMNRAQIAFQWNNYVPFWEGDVFNKAKARNIARNRLMQRRYCIELKAEERKLEQMVEWLLANTANHVQHIIRNAIAERKRQLREGKLVLTGRFISTP